MTLRELRRKRGLSLEAVAILGDVDPATVSRVERGIVEPSRETIVKLARGLGIAPRRMRDILIASADEHLSEVTGG